MSIYHLSLSADRLQDGACSVFGCWRLRSSADGNFVDFQGRLTDAYGHGLTFLATGTHAHVELEIVADHRDLRQRFGTIADQHCALDDQGEVHGWGVDAAIDQPLGDVERPGAGCLLQGGHICRRYQPG